MCLKKRHILYFFSQSAFVLPVILQLFTSHLRYHYVTITDITDGFPIRFGGISV
jgi:hypothetical protein